MLNAGVNITIEDNWLNGGEYAVNNGPKTVTGSFARNRFGRGMAQKGTGDTSYYALMVTSTGLSHLRRHSEPERLGGHRQGLPRNKGR